MAVSLVTALGLLWVLQPENSASSLAASLHDARSKLERREVHIPIKRFSLIDQSNRIFKFEDVRGKILLVDFAYTTCPDLCPLLTATMAAVQRELRPDERSRVYLLTVTTDPEVDSPAVLAAYARRYGADLSNWSFLTGHEPSLAKVWRNFGVGVKKISRGLVNHTALTAIVDAEGVMRFGYYGTAPDSKTVLRDMRSLRAP
ncbi:MAG TPA: SCO family protein [Terriglobales bacterium]|nr:SCO family protein [Terriglobales bacterium]